MSNQPWKTGVSSRRRRVKPRLNEAARQRRLAKKQRGRNRRLQSRYGAIRVLFPVVFSIELPEWRVALHNAIAQVMEHVKRKKRVLLDLEFVQSPIEPSAMLYFVASIEGLSEAERKLLECELPIDQVAYEVFLHVGPDCLKPKQRDGFEPQDESVRNWCKITGSRANSQEATDGFYDFTGGSEKDRGCKTITAGVGEALLNAKNHAYDPGGNRGWWLFYERGGGKLTVCVCDLGVGIRATVRASLGAGDYARDVVRAIQQRRPLLSDSYFIELALEDRRTSTKEDGRGQGLQDIERVVRHDALSSASLTILSSRGMVVRSQDPKKERSVDFAIALPGTIVQWQLALPTRAEP